MKIPGRIAVIAHQHPSVSKGGAEISAYTLFHGLLEVGADAIFIAACDERQRSRLHLASEREFAVFHDPATYEHLYHAAMPQVTDSLRAILEEQGVEVASFHHWFFLGLDSLDMAMTGLGLRVVVTLHEFLAICQHHGQMVTRPARVLCERDSLLACGDCFPEYRRMQFALRRERFQRILGEAAALISPSRFLARRFIEWGADPARMHVIENGLLHLPAPAAPRPRASGGPWRFGYFGQINAFKGVDVLLRACEAIARDSELAGQVQIEVHGNVVGSPEFERQLERAVEQHPFLAYRGAYTNQVVNRLMQGCDYVLMLSTWWENSPVVIQEAYAAGCPVLSPSIGGMAEKVLDGVTGLHFRPADPVDLVRAIREAMAPGMHGRLAAALPRPAGARDMAMDYLRHLQPQGGTGAAVSAPVPPPTKARRRKA